MKLVEMNLQRTAALAGASLGYAPPEQYEQGNQRVSPRTDVFSLAAVVYEMLAGKPAFSFNDGENPLLIVTRILNGPRPDAPAHARHARPRARVAVRARRGARRELVRAFAADPMARHESVMEFWKAVEPPLRAAAEDKPLPVASSAVVSGFDATARVVDSDGVRGSGSGIQRAAAVIVQPARESAQPSGSAGSGTARGSCDRRPRRLHRSASPRRTPRAPRRGRGARSTVPSPRPARFAAVVFRATGDGALAISSNGILRWERGSWSPLPLPAHIPRAALRGVRWLSDASILLYGENSLVARVMPNGSASIWRVPDTEITYLGALRRSFRHDHARRRAPISRHHSAAASRASRRASSPSSLASASRS